jgi:predicted RNase H-like nuclease (RuvC/YqgF family)
MFKELIDAAVASLLEPYAEEVRQLKAENEALKARVTALEARPEPFDVRSYIEQRIEEEVGKLTSAAEVAELIKGKALTWVRT